MDSLLKEVTNVLPTRNWRLVYMQLDAVNVKPLILGNPRPVSYKIRHYFELLTEDNVVVMGIEIFVYLQVYNAYFEQYVFVPKCDTVGLERVDFQVGKLIEVCLQWVLKYSPTNYKTPRKNCQEESSKLFSTEPETVYRIRRLQKMLKDDNSLIQRWNSYPKFKDDSINSKTFISLPPKRRLHIAFFTKASPLYLFPNLDRNPFKRVASGPKLLRWWMRIVGNVTKDQEWERFLDIPGADANEIAKYLGDGWQHGNIYAKDGLAVKSIPLFPDDPKGRFLEHLIVEGRHSKVSTKSFYHEIGFRQEFRLGDVVGLIGCTLELEEFNSAQDETIVPITLLSSYKRFLRDTKSIDYSNRSQSIMDTKSILEEVNVFNFRGLCSERPQGSSQPQKLPVNNLQNLIKKRPANDLTAQIRKKAKK